MRMLAMSPLQSIFEEILDHVEEDACEFSRMFPGREPTLADVFHIDALYRRRAEALLGGVGRIDSRDDADGYERARAVYRVRLVTEVRRLITERQRRTR
jgi:hypothetical protein